MNWLPSEDGQRLVSSEGYEIRAERPPYPGATQQERWFTAYAPDGCEVASGYLEAGLAKCKRCCEEHAARPAPDSQPRDEVAPIAKAVSESFVSTPAVQPQPQSSLF